MAGLTGQGTPRGLCVMPRGRHTVGQRLKSAVVDWCAASSVGLASAFACVPYDRLGVQWYKAVTKIMIILQKETTEHREPGTSSRQGEPGPPPSVLTPHTATLRSAYTQCVYAG